MLPVGYALASLNDFPIWLPMERVVVFVSSQRPVIPELMCNVVVEVGMYRSSSVCCTISTVVCCPLPNCKQPEHNAGLIIVATSCLLHLATQFL